MYKYKCKECGHVQSSKDNRFIIHICDKCGKVDIPLYSIDLYKARSLDVIRVMENELLRRKLGDPVGIVYVWKMQNGEKIFLHNMTSDHLQNTIAMIRNKIKSS